MIQYVGRELLPSFFDAKALLANEDRVIAPMKLLYRKFLLRRISSGVGCLSYDIRYISYNMLHQNTIIIFIQFYHFFRANANDYS